MKKKYKIKYKSLMVLFLFIILICFTGYNLYKIIYWCIENNQIEKENKNLIEIADIKDVVEEEPIPEVEEEEEIVEENIFNPYFDYINVSLFDVDFSSLKEVNNEVVGWINVESTNINYPVVRHSDNSYYLTRTFNQRHNSSGWVFMDYRNTNDGYNYDRNTIIYAHGRVNGSMFGTLKNTLKESWFNNKDNHIIKYVTENTKTAWQIFSVYHIPTTSDYIETEFLTDEEYEEFINLIKSRSVHNFDLEVTKDDKILTLSTCYNNEEKMVVHAKLVKLAN